MSETMDGVLNAIACQEQPLRALRANRVSCTDEKRIRTENTVLVYTRHGLRFYTRSSIARGYAFHPCAIDDPRGRFFVRAKSQFRSNEGAN